MDLRVDPVLAKVGPQDPPKRPRKWVPKGSQVRKGRKYKNICFRKENQCFLPPEGAPNGPEIVPKSLQICPCTPMPFKIWSKRAPRGLRGRKKVVSGDLKKFQGRKKVVQEGSLALLGDLIARFHDLGPQDGARGRRSRAWVSATVGPETLENTREFELFASCLGDPPL